MALATYSDLKSKISGFLARSGLDAEIADAIAMFETEYNSGEDNYFSETAYTFTTTAGVATIDLPADFNEHVSLLRYNYGNIAIVSLSSLNSRISGTRGAPVTAALYPGNKLKFEPIPDGIYTMELVYEANLPTLGTTVTSNWMLVKYPFVYVYGALRYMLEYLQDGQRADAIEGKYSKFMSQIQGKKAGKKLGNTPVMRAGNGRP